jgi:hypothetical protein
LRWGNYRCCQHHGESKWQVSRRVCSGAANWRRAWNVRRNFTLWWLGQTLSHIKASCYGTLLITACNANNKSVEQRPSSETNSRSASQEISRRLWNPKVHHRVPKDPPLVPILSQTNRVHTLPLYTRTIHFNIILSCALLLLSSWIKSTFDQWGR